MGQIKVEKNVGGISGLCVIEPAVHGDKRGYFMETYSQRDMEEAGIDVTFVQDNQSCSSKGVLRGLHFQKDFPQTKLVRVIKGRVFDVAVDLRKIQKHTKNGLVSSLLMITNFSFLFLRDSHMVFLYLVTLLSSAINVMTSIIRVMKAV